MEYNSFYGGRQGTPFIIAAKYDSINDMINAFAGGNNYKVVAYNEYVIIDTINKNDADNGKIYRRIETDPGYEYIGQIVGPAGPAPMMEMDNYNTVLAKTGSTEGVFSVADGDLIPGKNGNTYNDTIKYVYCSVRDVNGSDTTVYFGLKIPYMVIGMDATKVTPYTADLTPNLVSDSHPFYRKWTLKIPQGIKGDTFKNFRIITPSTDTSYDDSDGNAHTLYQDKSYLVYDYYNYDNSETPSPITYYLGDYNMIDSISEQDGVVTINYTNDDSQNLMTIKYITSIAITSSTGKMVVTYNTKTGNTYDTQSFNLTYVTSAALAQNGTFSYKKTTGSGTSTTTQSDKLTWIENAQVLSTGEFQTKKNTSNTWDTLTTIKSIDHIEIAQTGEFKVYYNTDASTPVQLATIKYITNVEGVSGYLKIDYNTGEPSTYIYQGTENSTGAIIAEESAEPDPVFAEGSPWFVVEEILPYKRRLDYIQSTGSQYIDLNTGIDNSLFEAQIKIELTATTNACNVFGADTNGQKEAFYIRNEHISSSNDDRYCLYAAGSVSNFATNSSGVRTLIVGIKPYNAEPNKYDYFYKYAGNIAGTLKDFLAEIDTLYLLNVKNKTGNYAPAKLYSFKLYKNNILTMDLIPVMNKNDIPCLYDEISGEFFYNAGTGNFLYGEVE